MILKNLAIYLLVASSAYAANLCVGTVSATITCNTIYTKTAQHVQDAMDDAVDGDTIYIEPGFRYSQAYSFRGDHSASPVTVTTGKPEWLPCANCRITPAHVPSVLPLLSSNINGCPTLQGVRDSGGNPPKGWIFDGLAISVDHEGTVYSLITNGGTGSSYQCGGDATSTYYITDANDAPDNITWNRIFAMVRFPDLNLPTTNGFFMQGSNITIKNSFLWPFYGMLNENHGIANLTGPGPLTVTNSYFGGSAIPYLAGGSNGDYVNSQPGGWTFRYNYFYRPWKNYPPTWDPTDFSITNLGSPCANPGVGFCYTLENPYPAYYATNLARHGGTNKVQCMKNMGEYKVVDGVTHQYNVHENQHFDGGGNCLGQYFGQTFTMRGYFSPNPLWWGNLTNIPGQSKWMDQDPPDGASLNAIINGLNNGSLRTSGTSFSWQSPCGDGGPPLPTCGTLGGYPLTYWLKPGNSICIDPAAKSLDTNYASVLHVFICREIATVSVDVTGATASTGTLVSAFPTDITVPSTTLSAGIDADTLTIPVASVTGWEPYMVAIVGTEFIQICSVGATDLTACADTPITGPNGRGYCLQDYNNVCGGGRASHSSGATIKRALTWHYNLQNKARYRDIVWTNNVMRNVATFASILAKDRVGATGSGYEDYSRIIGLRIENNLVYDTVPQHKKYGTILRMAGQEQVAELDGTVSGRDITIQNNTIDWSTTTLADNVPYTAISLVADGTPDSLAPKIGNLQIRSNLWPDADHFAIGLQIGGDQNSYSKVNTWTSGDSSITYNQLRYASLTTCAPSSCVGNKNGAYTTNVAFLPRTYKVAAGSAVSKAGHNGNDMGANVDQVPLIRNPSVKVSAKTALLEFDLTAPIKDAGNTQPCMLEVSANEELQSYIGLAGQNWTLPYTVTNDLNPGYFKQANESTRTNASLLRPIVTAGGHVYWPIGQDTSVNDDNSPPVSRDLALISGTQYWYRLMCYGDTYHGTFTTSGSAGSETTMPITFGLPDGAASAKIEYGTTYSLGSSTTGTASATVTTTPGGFQYRKRTYYSGAGGTGSVIKALDMEIVLP